MAEDGDAQETAACVGDDGYVSALEASSEPLMINSWGFLDGSTFHLRTFPVWYRWRPWQYQQAYNAFTAEKPETGSVKGVWFEQTMGKMVLWYELVGLDESLTEEDLVVEMSSWELRVAMGTRKIEPLCREFNRDVRRRFSWWQITENQEHPGRWLMMSLAKLEHRPWRGPWFTGAINPHKRAFFPWTPYQVSQQLAKLLKPEDEELARVLAGAPQEPERDACTGVLPERLCTGIDDDQNDTDEQISILLHLDEETLELTTGMVPMEELFSADVAVDCLEVCLRFDRLALCSGALTGRVVPERTTWEIANVRRLKLPEDAGIKCPAFYNPALRITLVKSLGYQQPWGRAFAEPLPRFEPPRERMSWTERVQRALILSPAAPLQLTAKTARALKMCTRIECYQDSILNKAYVIMHLEERLEELATKFKVDVSTFFSMKVGERVLEVNVVADAEFRMCVGGLGGRCVPDKTTWEITRERSTPEEDQDHLALRVGLSKASDGTGPWPEVFTRWEPWQISENLHRALSLDASGAHPSKESGDAQVRDALFEDKLSSLLAAANAIIARR